MLGANDAYEAGLKHDPNNAQLKSGLASVEKAMQQEAGGDNPMGGLGDMFKDPNMIQKLAANPKTAAYLADPSFMAKLQQIQQNPLMSQDMFSDPRMIQVLGVMMGVDMEVRDSPPEGSQSYNVSEDTPMPDAPKKTPEPKKAPEPEPEPEIDEEALEKKKKKRRLTRKRPLAQRTTRSESLTRPSSTTARRGRFTRISHISTTSVRLTSRREIMTSVSSRAKRQSMRAE